MSRRDTIIIAVLVNAGLLIVLFASALKSHAPGEDFAAAPTLQEVREIRESSEFHPKKEATAIGGDEVDRALSQFTQNAVAANAQNTPSATLETSGAPAHTSATAAVPTLGHTSFAEDLKPIPAPEAPPVAVAENPGVHTLMAPVAPQSGPSTTFTEIKVKKGDVLEKIARHHHTTVAEIMKANKLTTTNLRIGQVLKIPVKSIRKAENLAISFSGQSTPAQSGDGVGKFYTIVKGDNPWTIAVKNHLRVEDLLKLNNMSEDQARRLKPGDRIRIQ